MKTESKAFWLMLATSFIGSILFNVIMLPAGVTADHPSTMTCFPWIWYGCLFCGWNGDFFRSLVE